MEKNRRWRPYNPQKDRAKSRKWRANNPEKARAAERNWRVNNPEKRRSAYRRYRVDYDAMLKAQEGRCLICKDLARGRLCVDEEPGSDPIIVRGLLCLHCNSLLGFARQKPETLANALYYLGWHKSKPTSVAPTDSLPNKATESPQLTFWEWIDAQDSRTAIAAA